MNSSKRLLVKGAFWNAVQLTVNQVFTFGIKLLLAKLLLPQQFGIIGMATVFSGFVQVFNDLGIGAALVQRKDEDLREEHFHTAFWTGVGWSFILYIIISVICGPLVAEFYHQPILTKLIPVLSLGILSSPVNLVHKAQLTKQMDFKKMAVIENIGNIAAGLISLILAYMGAGVWALAFDSVAIIVLVMPLYFRATGWKPKFIWSKKAFKDVFGFGIFTTGTNVLNYMMNNTDYLLIGKLLSAQALGAYTFAFVLTDTFRGRLMAVINNVMYPFYGRNQSNPELLKKYYLKVVSYNCVLIFPIMLFMYSLGQPFIFNFFGSKWHDTIVPLRILAVSVMVHMLVNSNTALIRGMGRPGLEMKLQLIKSFIFVPTLAVGIFKYGIIGAAWAILINKVVAVIIAQYTFKYLLNMRVKVIELFNSIKQPFIGMAVAYGIVYLLYNVLHLYYIIAAVALFGSYSLIIWYTMGAEIKAQIQEFKQSRK